MGNIKLTNLTLDHAELIDNNGAIALRVTGTDQNGNPVWFTVKGSSSLINKVY